MVSKVGRTTNGIDLLYGYITIDSDISYGGGVEWHGNPFTNIVSTIQKDRRALYTPESTDLDIASSFGSRIRIRASGAIRRSST